MEKQLKTKRKGHYIPCSSTSKDGEEKKPLFRVNRTTNPQSDMAFAIYPDGTAAVGYTPDPSTVTEEERKHIVATIGYIDQFAGVIDDVTITKNDSQQMETSIGGSIKIDTKNPEYILKEPQEGVRESSHEYTFDYLTRFIIGLPASGNITISLKGVEIYSYNFVNDMIQSFAYKPYDEEEIQVLGISLPAIPELGGLTPCLGFYKRGADFTFGLLFNAEIPLVSIALSEVTQPQMSIGKIRNAEIIKYNDTLEVNEKGELGVKNASLTDFLATANIIGDELRIVDNKGREFDFSKADRVQNGNIDNAIINGGTIEDYLDEDPEEHTDNKIYFLSGGGDVSATNQYLKKATVSPTELILTDNHGIETTYQPTMPSVLKIKGTCLQADLPATGEAGDTWFLNDEAPSPYAGQMAIWIEGATDWKYTSATVAVDYTMSETSTRPVANKTITKALKERVGCGNIENGNMWLTSLAEFEEKKEDAEVGTIAYIKDDLVNLDRATNLVNIIYPVGIITSFATSIDPNVVWEGTVWERLPEGIFLMNTQINSELGKTGGEKEHTLTTEEMPTHSHGCESNGWHQHHREGYWTVSYVGDTKRECVSRYQSAGGSIDYDNGAGTHSHTIKNKGDGKAHNNLPPYLKVAMWQRLS